MAPDQAPSTGASARNEWTGNRTSAAIAASHYRPMSAAGGTAVDRSFTGSGCLTGLRRMVYPTTARLPIAAVARRDYQSSMPRRPMVMSRWTWTLISSPKPNSTVSMAVPP